VTGKRLKLKKKVIKFNPRARQWIKMKIGDEKNLMFEKIVCVPGGWLVYPHTSNINDKDLAIASTFVPNPLFDLYKIYLPVCLTNLATSNHPDHKAIKDDAERFAYASTWAHDLSLLSLELYEANNKEFFNEASTNET